MAGGDSIYSRNEARNSATASLIRQLRRIQEVGGLIQSLEPLKSKAAQEPRGPMFHQTARFRVN